MQQASGATIETGPHDWQIFQQDSNGRATFDVSGRWDGPAGGRVEVRLVQEATGACVAPLLDWQRATTSPNYTWRYRLRGVPAGGLYRLETRYNPPGNVAGEWSLRGDMRHFIGVGDLWVIAGQSNAAGYGRGPLHDPPELGVHLFGNNERWNLAAHPLNESTGIRHPVTREATNPAHSPYLHFGKELQRAVGHPIGLIQTALGGPALTQWDATAGPAPLFHNMIHCISLAGGRVKGIVWYQGETDGCDEATAVEYGARFARIVRAWRRALKNAALPIITVQLNRRAGIVHDPIGDRRRALVREAQRQAAHSLPHVSVVPALDLPLSDIGHNAPAGNIVLAERMARTALGAVYGRDIAYRAPEISDAVAGRGRVVELYFNDVSSRLETLDPRAQPFMVVDEMGDVPVQRVVYRGRVVRLQLARALHGAARVHGGYGLDPPPVPVDVERQLPMLAFYDVPVRAGTS